MFKSGSIALSAIVGCSMLALSFAPASAFTLAGPSLEQPVASAQVDKVWYRCGWGRCGWGPGAVIGGLAAGAIIGALATPYYYDAPYRHCWRGYYGRLHCD